ncbi:MAG TPA: NAD(P)/FAD-dependent oxidoreductase [Firmicutes bacterium]|jgi:glycerol-3-phosphate dehydrogenase|nr:NAD(P)/FAD-dependent oxidoreductase [Bacillota bacterium]
MQTIKADVVIVGAGVTGAVIARELSRYELKVVVLEKEADVCAGGSSKANTAIVHAGYDATPGTWKAKLNVRGVELYDQMCCELDVPYQKKGTLVVALAEDQVPHLEELLERGKINGVPDLEIIGRDRILKMEPHINPEAVAALYAPGAGIVCPYELTIALAENAVMNGVQVLLSQPVTGIAVRDGRVQQALTPEYRIDTSFVINAAGLYADEIARMVGQDYYHIIPRKGEYYIFDKRFGGLINRPLFPVPTEVSKGILVTPTVDGNLLIGPNAENIEDKEDTATTPEGLQEVLTGALAMVPDLPLRERITTYAGLRNVAMPSNDFVLGPAPGVKGFINAGGIQSPGLTAAPAIAEVILNVLAEEGLELRPKASFNPERKTIPHFREMSPEERREAIAQNPAYGQIVCRCETVTEAEILQAIHRPIPATTVDAVKRRTRAGMGRCQGGFCTPRVMALLVRELGIPWEEVTKKGGSSQYVVGRTKDLLFKNRE